MVAVPLLFLKHIEKKYSIVLVGKKTFSFLSPHIKITRAAFIWADKVELVEGDLDVEVNAWEWLTTRIWTMKLVADGAALRFVGDWLKKTGVESVRATRLRVDIDWDDHGIHEIHAVELISPQYQFQIKNRAG